MDSSPATSEKRGLNDMKGLLIIAGIVCLFATRGFSQDNATNWKWTCSKFARIENNHVIISVPTNQACAGGAARTRIDLKPYKGKALRLSILAQGTLISEPRDPWNGFKFMLHYTDQDTQKKFWSNCGPRLGSFGPTNVVTMIADFDQVNATEGELTLGLQDSSGHVTFDLSTLTITAEEPLFALTNQTYRIRYPESLQKTPALRGVMLPGGPCKEEDFQTLQRWGATLARYQMTRNWGMAGTDQDLADYDCWLNSKLDHLEQVLIWGQRYGIKIVVDLHSPPGGRTEKKEMTMFYDARFADHFVRVWQRIATRFKHRPEIFGFDLINEPNQLDRAPIDYWNLQRRAAEAIRAIDPDTTLIVEANAWDSPEGFRYLSPLAMDNVIYQVHMYEPGTYTHQGVHAHKVDPKNSMAYPGKIEHVEWNRERIRTTLKFVREFQERHQARIYVGEFSAIAWAPGAEQYIADCISVFNEYGWDWTYHAFREWAGWSVEHEGTGHTTLKPANDTPRKRVLLQGLKP